ncbi:MAG TPA: PD-(D/E)XK nuclease family protein [Anaerolineae bacterium]|nr:PD-(D/E)XK nuclease family protein [Anaerolineae bacterium]
MTPVLLALSAALLAIALWLALRARRGQQQSGLPQGRLIYTDTGRWSAVAQPYFSQRYRLAGKPDYLVDSDDGLVPVEVKHTAAPAGGQAYASHIMQLAAYCLLVEEAHGGTPPYGLIRYDDAIVQLDYTQALRDELLDLLDDLRASRGMAEVGRNHHEAARCRACGVRHACGANSLD